MLSNSTIISDNSTNNDIPNNNDTINILLLISYQIVGYLITFVSFTFKLPQIYTLIKTKSTKSLSTLSNYFDFYSVLFQGLYSIHKGLSILIYLEYFSTTTQNLAIIILAWYFNENSVNTFQWLMRIMFMLTTPYLILISCINNGDYIPEVCWTLMVLCGLPFMSISRLSQIREIYIKKAVGAVSMSSFVLRATKNFLKVIVIAIEVVNWPLIINQAYYGILTLGVIAMIAKYTPKKNIIKYKELKQFEV